eukprot:SAG11_NODE_4606_length_1838_cov_1.256469_4_plen_87_part_00
MRLGAHACARVQYEGSASELSQADRHRAIRKLSGFVDHAPALGAIARSLAMLRVIGRLLNVDAEEVTLIQDMALLKLAVRPFRCAF